MTSSAYIKKLRAAIGHESLLIPAVAAVILNENKELLLQQKPDKSWSLPAGMIEPGESPGEAVIREVREETGLIVSVERVLGVFGGKDFCFTYANGDKVEYTVILCRCRVISRSDTQIDPETESLGYFSKTAMPSLALPYPLQYLFDEVEKAFIA